MQEAVQSLADDKIALVELVEDPRQADWIILLHQGRVDLVEAFGSRAPFPLLPLDNPCWGEAMRTTIEKVYRASKLVALGHRYEAGLSRDGPTVDVEVEVLRHKDQRDPGEVRPVPIGEWIFRPGDFISFRVRNKSPATRVDLTLLVVGSDFTITPFYPKTHEMAQSIGPGEILTTPPPWGEISKAEPFGPESLVVIVAPVTIPPWTLRS